MDTFKNFFIGLFVIVISLVIFGVVLLTWPFILGISSILLTVIAAVLFLILVFYIIVLVGHITRLMIKK